LAPLSHLPRFVDLATGALMLYFAVTSAQRLMGG
jgi:hypothetical protein